MKMIKQDYKYVIISPRQAWGGAVVLHALCKYLCDLGYDASILYVSDMNYKNGHRLKFWLKHFIFTISDIYKANNVRLYGEENYINNRKYKGYVNEAVKGCKRRIYPFVKENEIVIYPERVYGNFTRAKKVVRWFLYHNRYDSGAYGNEDLFVTYRDVFNDSVLNPDNKQLYIAYYNLDTYRRYNFGERHGSCYVLRKGKDREDLPQYFDGPIIDELPEDEKVRIFNESEFCVSYDTQTAYSSLAALCGCVSIVVPEKGKSRDDYRKNEISYGEAFGFSDEEINYAVNTRDKLNEIYQLRNLANKHEVENFVKECRKHFGKG